MKKKKISSVLFITFTVVFVFSLFSMNSGQTESGNFTREFQVKPGGELDIELKAGGSIFIEGWDKDEVMVEARITGRDADEISFSAEQENSGVKVFSEYTGEKNNVKCKIKVKIKVPLKYDILFNTMGGEVQLSNIDGEFSGKTMGGELEINKLTGKAELKTMGGAINIKDSRLDGYVKTMGGAIDIDNVTGDLNAKTMGGAINYRNNLTSGGEMLNISTMGGAINVDEASGGADISTMGGSIRIGKIGNKLKAKTMGGDIDIEEAAAEISAETMGGDIEANITGANEKGDGDIKLKSMGGDINVSVPDNYPMDIRIEITYDADDGKPEIHSDFELSEEIEDVDDDDWDSGDKKRLIAEGKSGSGMHKVFLKTYQGNVTLSKK